MYLENQYIDGSSQRSMAPHKSGNSSGMGFISGGNTTLFKMKNGKYVRKKNVSGGGILGNILKHVNKHKSKIMKIGTNVGKKVLKEAKSQLRKPENQKLLRKVANQLIEKVTDDIGQRGPIKRKSSSHVGHKRRAPRKRSRLSDDLLSLTKKEAKKIGSKKSKELVEGFANYTR